MLFETFLKIWKPRFFHRSTPHPSSICHWHPPPWRVLGEGHGQPAKHVLPRFNAIKVHVEVDLPRQGVHLPAMDPIEKAGSLKQKMSRKLDLNILFTYLYMDGFGRNHTCGFNGIQNDVMGFIDWNGSVDFKPPRILQLGLAEGGSLQGFRQGLHHIVPLRHPENHGDKDHIDGTWDTSWAEVIEIIRLSIINLSYSWETLFVAPTGSPFNRKYP